MKVGRLRERWFGAVVDQQTMAGILTRIRSTRDDEDLAALVRSAGRPGLSRRIAAYRGQLAKR